MNTHMLSPDTQATLLLCGRLGQKSTAEPQPLTPAEYRGLVRWLYQHNLRPGDLLQPAQRQKFFAEQITANLPVPERIDHLLERGTALALAVEGWTNKGLWVISRTDSAYPQQLRERLKQAAPPILYGAGDQTLLNRGGMVIVGSRDIDAAGIQATRTLAQQCARQDIAVISGGARGVDTEAILATLDADGHAIGILADSLAKASVDKKYRDAIRAGHLVLISPYDPSAGFNVGHAMERNKYMYALGEWSFVVSSGYQQGGTWAGAIEQLERHQWIPVYIRSGPDVPHGNNSLVERGGIACNVDTLTDDMDIRDWLTSQTSESEKQHTVQKQNTSALSQDLFVVVWPYLEQELHMPHTPEQLRGIFPHVLVEQLRSWLKHAEKLGKVQRVSEGAYVVHPQNTGALEMEHASRDTHEQQPLLL